jgi:glycine/D-amino acid oxidase-like deaminating enzyme
MNRSPRLAQIAKRHSYHSHQTQSDIAIIWWWIAGVMTAYHLLKHTHHWVAIYEARQIAHGATGHNAGQVAPYFEKDRDDIVEEYGLEMAADAQQAIFIARDRLLEILDYTNCPVPFHSQLGYAWCSTDEQIEHHLHKKLLREQGKSSFDAIFICDSHPKLSERQARYPDLFETMTDVQIRDHLETESQEFMALLVCRKAVVNSAALCEYLVQWMLTHHHGKISIHEQTPIDRIELYNDGVRLTDTQWLQHQSRQIVLCTNGFEHFEIINHGWDSIDASFHDTVYGKLWYMSAYCDTNTSYKPIAISYFMKEDAFATDEFETYFYFTRRPYQFAGQSYTLVSVGGPEDLLGENTYDHTADHPQQAHNQNIEFLQTYYKHAQTQSSEVFRWHGLMGYTKTWLRMVGPHPYNDRLWLNLWCNGVGILTSIYGSYKIARMMAGDEFGPSVFDVSHSLPKI